MQGYMAVGEIVDGVISDAQLDWQTERQARFAASNVLDALAPTNFPVVQPRGSAGDPRRGRRQPRAPNLAVSQGSVVLRRGLRVDPVQADDGRGA
jgi:hypothetical protein